MGNYKFHGCKKFKTKAYSLRLNDKLVERVQELTGESPQNIIDRAYEEFIYLMDEIIAEEAMEEM
jgi:hypothetical protein